MMISVLVCDTDGSQHLEQREVPENWFDIEEPLPAPKKDSAE